MARLTVRPATRPLRGAVPVPSDPSITHRALLLAALSNGPSELRGFGYGRDTLQMLSALGRLGVPYEDDGRGTVKVRGVGLRGFHAPEESIDCGGSETALHLLMGVLAGQPFASRLSGGAPLQNRDVAGIVRPLERRGARIRGCLEGEGIFLPLDMLGVEPQTRLAPFEYVLEGANDHAKAALLLSGLFASGPTTIIERVIARDHTERLLDALGVSIETAGPVLRLHPPLDPLAVRGFSFDVPGDISSAAFVLVAAQLVKDSVVSTRRTSLNPTRSAILDIIRLFGGRMGITPGGESLGEPFGEVSSRGSVLRGTPVAGELAERALDEIPAVCALAARARGVTEISDVGALRLTNPDRLHALARLLGAFGVRVQELPDGLVIEGTSEPLTSVTVSSEGDPSLAMTAGVLALVADGPSVIENVDCIAASFPRFAGTLRALGAELEITE